MTDIPERLRSRYNATFLDEAAAREIEALRAERDRAVAACEQLIRQRDEARAALRPFAAAWRNAGSIGIDLDDEERGQFMRYCARAAELVPPEGKPE